MASPVQSFISKFSSDRNFFLPLQTMWTVTISDNSITGAINSALSKVDTYSGWKVNASDLWTDKSLGNILVAQEVTIPSESYEVSEIIADGSTGAYMAGYGVSKRAGFLSRNLTVNFIETHADIEAALFRPWAIALSIDGLINSGLKAQAVNITQYGRDMSKRKEYIFYDVFPTNTEGATYNYTTDDIKAKTITFGYRDYKVVQF
jgi:hypothetical protein